MANIKRKAIIYQWQYGVGYEMRILIYNTHSARYEYKGFYRFYDSLYDAEKFIKKYIDIVEFEGSFP